MSDEFTCGQMMSEEFDLDAPPCGEPATWFLKSGYGPVFLCDEHINHPTEPFQPMAEWDAVYWENHLARQRHKGQLLRPGCHRCGRDLLPGELAPLCADCEMGQ